MFHTILSRAGLFILLTLLQVLVFNHIHIMGYATPMPYIYFLITLPSNLPRWAFVLLGFILGFLIDMFGNTPGVATISLTFMGLITPILFKLFGPNERDNNEVITPSMQSMERNPFLRYIFVASFFLCLLFFVIEAFNFFNARTLIINILGSTALTFLFIVAIEVIKNKK